MNPVLLGALCWVVAAVAFGGLWVLLGRPARLDRQARRSLGADARSWEQARNVTGRRA